MELISLFTESILTSILIGISVGIMAGFIIGFFLVIFKKYFQVRRSIKRIKKQKIKYGLNGKHYDFVGEIDKQLKDRQLKKKKWK